MNIRILLFLLISSLFSAFYAVPVPYNYDAAWFEVGKLEQKGLPKTMMDKVDEIYHAAKKDGNDNQMIKALIYKLTYLQNVEEDAAQKAINAVTEDIGNSTFPSTGILHSMLAQLYWSYYSVNRWRFQDRTEILNFRDDDISTWDLKTITKKTIEEYQLSLVNPQGLKNQSIADFNLVIRPGDAEGNKFRPTLYDFLAHRALDFYMNDESGLTTPSDEFKLSNNAYFQPAVNFIQMSIVTPDSLSLRFLSMKTLQDVMRFHSTDTDKDAYIASDLDRLEYVYDNYAAADGKSLYETSLRALLTQYSNSPVSALAAYDLATFLKECGDEYQPDSSDKYKWYYRDALDLCNSTINKFKNVSGFSGSYAGKNLEILKQTILEPSTTVQIESAVMKMQPIKAFVNQKNLKSIFVRIYRVKASDLMNKYNSNISDNDETKRSRLIKIKPMFEKEFTFPDQGDYRTHASEIVLPGLPTGSYMIIVSDNFRKNYSDQYLSYNSFSCTDLSFITRTSNDIYGMVLSRHNGLPLQNVNVKRFITKWDNNSSKNVTTLDWSGKTDKFGKVRLSESKYGYWNSQYMLYKDDDTLVINNIYLYPKDRRQYVRNQCTLFTDRGIYRPGQTIYFKGLLFETDMVKKNRILSHEPIKVTLMDVNYKQVSSLDFVTNEFGTFNGSFTAPKNVLTGQMTIQTPFGSTTISVEEYKRPTFEVTIDKPVDEYQLGQSVTLKGKVLSYAGFPLDHAKISYRVTRQPRWNFWYWWWGSHGSTPEKEIVQGTAITNENGEFNLSFLAQSDETVSTIGSPYFNFVITADATDQNGETRSGDLSLLIGNTNLVLNPSIPDKINQDEKKIQIPLKTTNLGGEPLNVKGTVTIWKLKSPDRVMKSRLWTKPDVPIIQKDEFIKQFPNDVFTDENLMSNWDREKQCYTGSFDTSENKTLELKGLDSWEKGAYLFEVTAPDKYGKMVKESRYFTLYSSKGTKIPYPMPDWFVPIKISGEPGEQASFLIGSGYDKVSVLYEVERDGKIVDSLRFVLNNEQRLFTVPILENDRGNFTAHFTFAIDNRIYTHDTDITVPWTNKKLDFEYMTFRNKLLPGQDEEWRLKIKDNSGGKVTSEILASMYDASLDAFRSNDWQLSIYRTQYGTAGWMTGYFVSAISLLTRYNNNVPSFLTLSYNSLNWYNYHQMSGDLRHFRGGKGVVLSSVGDGMNYLSEAAPTAMMNGRMLKKTEVADQAVSTIEADGSGRPQEDLSGIEARSNFAETAFFYPQLRTDENGEVLISFTTPESLTRWKFRALALTKDLQYGLTDSLVVTQKPLMVIPNAPRFLREGDTITFSTKVTSLNDEDQMGVCQLMLFDAITMKPVESVFKLKNAQQNFSVKKGESKTLEWDLYIPFGVEAVTYRVVAKAGIFSDGEEKTLPILTNRILVTESLPLPVRGHSKNTFVFNKLQNSSKSQTIRNYKLTLEYTSNPAWYAIQALPYLMEYPYECNEQVFSRYYANSIASFIANSNPRIKRVFDSWRDMPNSEALLSNLEKNEELKSVMLQETPWVLDAKNENERKHRIGLLFDLNRMANEYDRALNRLKDSQMSNGAWSWFKGMPDSWWITQYIVEGFGHLDKLGIQNVKNDPDTWRMVQNAVGYLDRKIVEDYDNIFKYGNEKLDNLGYMEIHYLYARSFFLDIPLKNDAVKAVDYFKGQAEVYWLSKDKMGQGMLALATQRMKNQTLPAQIITSLKEHSLNSQEMGMYWKDNALGWYWYQAPIETQSILIEAFSDITPKDTTSIDNMRTWLLKQKQTTNWKTTKATTEACYALLCSGTEWLNTEKLCEIKLGDQVIDPKSIDNTPVEAGTGYFKTSWSGSDIKPTMAVVSITNPNNVASWGALYWQYFEDMDKITTADTPLKLSKKLFIERKTATGLVLDPVSPKSVLHVGDKVIVRIELRSDRDMEYVHMKDMRSSGFEPVNVISQYKWQDGLGYYESTGDAATNFFIEYLRKGTYVFEYPLWVSNKGDFSNGITSIQCMYAPEFTAHSEGIRVEVK